MFTSLPDLFAEYTCPNFFFVQIGANDGVTDDPIRKYILQYGWRGVFVEPLPDVFERLQANYEGMGRFEFLNAAVVDKVGSVTFYRHNRLPQCSGLGVKTRLQHVAQRVGELVEVEVSGMTMGQVLKRVQQPWGLLQIDTEGFDDQIVKMVPFGEMKPWIVRYEHKHLDGDQRYAVEQLLKEQGYALFWERNDTVAYHERRFS